MQTLETLIWFDNLTLGYDKTIVLKDLNIIVPDLYIPGHVTGQSICFLGRSGRGKSTLFKALSGLLKPLSGQIVLDNQGKYEQAREGSVGFVDQTYTLFRHKTVKQSLLFAMRKSSKSPEDKLQLIDDTLADWGLFSQKGKYPNELSGGQRQRVAIIEKLLASNHYIIMDEPISGLDIVAVDRVKQSFKQVLSAHEKNTIIFSTHDLHFAVEMADIIYVLGHPEKNASYSTLLKVYNAFNMDRALLYDEVIEVLKNS